MPAHHIEEGAERIDVEVMIPKTDVARVVGRKGETITGITDKRGVDIRINQGKEDQGDSVGVKISGYSQEAIDGAKADILAKLRASETVVIPALMLPFLESDRGRFRGPGGDSGVDFEQDRVVIRGDRAAVDAIKASVNKKMDEMVSSSFWCPISLLIVKIVFSTGKLH